MWTRSPRHATGRTGRSNRSDHPGARVERCGCAALVASAPGAAVRRAALVGSRHRLGSRVRRRDHRISSSGFSACQRKTAEDRTSTIIFPSGVRGDRGQFEGPFDTRQWKLDDRCRLCRDRSRGPDPQPLRIVSDQPALDVKCERRRTVALSGLSSPPRGGRAASGGPPRPLRPDAVGPSGPGLDSRSSLADRLRLRRRDLRTAAIAPEPDRAVGCPAGQQTVGAESQGRKAASNPLNCVRIAESITVQTRVAPERPTAASVRPSGENATSVACSEFGNWFTRLCATGSQSSIWPRPASASRLPCGLNRISQVYVWVGGRSLGSRRVVQVDRSAPCLCRPSPACHSAPVRRPTASVDWE